MPASRLVLALLALVLVEPASAAVIPVPAEVVVERIPGAKPRNVIFVLSDDHRFDAMSFMEHPLIVDEPINQNAR
jgi:N-acetylglucosamine-6-sulfatase